MRKQGLGGNYISIASKNGLVAGPNNVAYGTAKAAQQHMVRLLAAELAKDKIRVNTVNPDGVIVGSKIWEGAWAEGRAKADSDAGKATFLAMFRKLFVACCWCEVLLTALFCPVGCARYTVEWQLWVT